MLSGLNKAIRSSISLRFAILFCATFSVGIAAAFLVAYLRLSYTLERSSREVLVAKHSEIAAILTGSGVRGLREFLENGKNHILNAPYLFRVVDKNGETVYLKPSVQETTFDFDGAFKQHPDPEKLLGWRALPAVNDEDQFDLYTEKVGPDLYLEIGTSSEDRDDVLKHIGSAFLGIGIVFMVFSGGLGWWYARKTFAPVRKLLSTITTIEKGHLGERVFVDDSGDELNQLGQTFNRTIERIEKLVVVMRESLDNLAHEIRTPLTRIKVVAEDALISQEPTAVQEALADCAENVTVISDMVHQLMSISEAESGTLSLNYMVTPVQEMLDDVIDAYDFVAEEKSVEIALLPMDSDLYWSLDRRRIEQVIANLLDNALKFSAPHTRIELAAEALGSQLQIAVRDQGPGIPAADLDRIWDRLFRGDKSRSTTGAGLGLSIARAIVLAHGGTIEVVSDAGHGAIFIVRLPVPQMS